MRSRRWWHALEVLVLLLPLLLPAGSQPSEQSGTAADADVPVSLEAWADCGPSDEEQCGLSLRQLRGERRSSAEVHEHEQEGQQWHHPSCAVYGCGRAYNRRHHCQCNDACVRYGNCCTDFALLCPHIIATTTSAAPTPEPAAPPSPPPPKPTVPPPAPSATPQEPGHVLGEDPDCHTAIAADSDCYTDLVWAKDHGVWEHPETYEGLAPSSSLQEFQYWFYKKGLAGCKMPCGRRPAPDDPHAVLTRVTQGVPPPTRPFQYNGIAWPTLKIRGTGLTHFFAVGDWGGLAGQLPHNSQIIQYEGGGSRGPHTMGRYRTDAKTHDLTCSTPQMADCFGTQGKLCTGLEKNTTLEKCCQASCGWEAQVDVQAQLLVAAQMKKRAELSDPKFILNVGDNFYWGGIFGMCGSTDMSRISDITQTQFKWIFEDIYKGPGLDGKPWLSTLGNHDWGGRQFTAAWDQQIAYTWTSQRWVLPAAYWMQHIEYVDQNFTVDVFLIDSNVEDALENVSASPEHNICGEKHNAEGSSCASIGGIPSIQGCHDWFQELWVNGSTWVREKMRKSEADWQILVTHFPCGHKAHFYRELHLKYGLDLMVTGHVHFQMMYWDPGRLGGLTCFITGGGGGITSENSVDMKSGRDHQYGFFDLTISKAEIGIESINWNGTTIGTWTVGPTVGTDTPAARNAPCKMPTPGDDCYKAVTWAMNDGIYGHPSWFPGLTSQATFAEFQNHFYLRHKDGCPKPCLDA